MAHREAGGGARQHRVGALKARDGWPIEKACDAILKGKYHDQFVVDWYQGGAGTSTNMNANEVMANIGPRDERATRRANTGRSSRTTT